MEGSTWNSQLLRKKQSFSQIQELFATKSGKQNHWKIMHSQKDAKPLKSLTWAVTSLFSVWRASPFLAQTLSNFKGTSERRALMPSVRKLTMGSAEWGGWASLDLGIPGKELILQKMRTKLQTYNVTMMGQCGKGRLLSSPARDLMSEF